MTDTLFGHQEDRRLAEAVTIQIENALSRVQASPDVIAKLRPLIGYRKQPMPSREAQLVIRSWFKRHGRRGFEQDHDRIFDDKLAAKALADLGWPRWRIDKQMLENTLRSNGWDGWTTLVTTAGWFGTGLVEHVQRALTLRLDCTVRYRDQRLPPAPLHAIGERPELWQFQADAVESWHASGGRGVVPAPPRTGKTRIAIAIAHDVALPTLVVVPTKVLVEQTVAAFRQFFPEEEVQPATGGRQGRRAQRLLNHARIWIATPKTAVNLPGILTRELLVFDEFHHAASATWQAISQAAKNAYYRLGLTGTHYRADGLDMVMHSVLSKRVYEVSVTDLVDAGILVRAAIAMVRIPGELEATGQAIRWAGLVRHEWRNAAIVYAITTLVERGCRVMVLCFEVEHAERIAAAIAPHVRVIQVDGRDNDRVRPALQALERHEVDVVVGSSVIGEGVDVPAADALVYAAGGKSRVKVVQDYFRVLTASLGKERAIVVDFADAHHPNLARASARRLGIYRLQPKFTADVVEIDGFDRWLDDTFANGGDR